MFPETEEDIWRQMVAPLEAAVEDMKWRIYTQAKETVGEILGAMQAAADEARAQGANGSVQRQHRFKKAIGSFSEFNWGSYIRARVNANSDVEISAGLYGGARAKFTVAPNPFIPKIVVGTTLSGELRALLPCSDAALTEGTLRSAEMDGILRVSGYAGPRYEGGSEIAGYGARGFVEAAITGAWEYSLREREWTLKVGGYGRLVTEILHGRSPSGTENVTRQEFRFGIGHDTGVTGD